MTEALQVLQYAVSLVFVLLGLVTLRDYLRQRERSRGFLALAIGLLGIVSVGSLVQRFTGPLGIAFSDLLVVIFLASGYALLLFRGSFIPIPPRTQWAALAALAVVAVAFIVVNPGSASTSPTLVQGVTTLLLVAAWSACVAEPIYRFWRASSHRPAV